MKPLTVLFFFATLILVSGCATTDKIVLDNAKRSPTTDVDIYKDRNMPVRGYKEIAELSYLGPREDELKALNRFIRQAKQMGGNGIIFTPTYGGTKGGGTIFQSEAWVFKASVIIYQDGSARSGSGSAGDKSLESQILGHWQSVSVNVTPPGAETIIFAFLPESQFSETSVEKGKAYVMTGRYSVRNGRLSLLAGGEARANPDEAFVISLEGDNLKMSDPVGSGNIIFKKIP